MNTQPQALPTVAIPVATAAPQPATPPATERKQPVAPPAAPPAEAAAKTETVVKPLETLTSISEVYEQAGIRTPGHGFSILKIADMLGSTHIRDFAPEMRKSSILLVLESAGVPLNDVIEDAVRRDRVLNEYEARQQKAWQDFKLRKQQQNREIQDEIERLLESCRVRMEANEKEIATEKARLDEWRSKKREEERKIRTTASPFSPNAFADIYPAGSDAVEAAPAQGPVAVPDAKKPVEAQGSSAVAANAAAAGNAAGKGFRWKK